MITTAGWTFTIGLVLVVLILSVIIGIITQSFMVFFTTFLTFSLVAEILWAVVLCASGGEYSSQVSKEIVSIKQDKESLGQFFLGTGSIKNRSTYVMYIKEGNNTYKLLEVYTSDYYIVEDDNIAPNITYYGSMQSWFRTVSLMPQMSQGIIYVPKGTIQIKFQL